MPVAESIETSKRFSFSPDPERIPAEEVKSAFKEFVEQQQIQPEVANAILTRLWFLRVDYFREEEENFMIKGQYVTSLIDHRYTLSKLIADGELLLVGAKKFGLAKNSWNFHLPDLEATLNSLYITFRCEHGAKNSQKTNERIEKLFNGKES